MLDRGQSVGGRTRGFEEPENGVHPRRLELIAELLWNIAHAQGGRERQIVVTTHSSLFCDAVLKLGREHKGDFVLLNATREGGRTVVRPFPDPGPMFDDQEIAASMVDPAEDVVFERLLRRGLIDA